MYMYCVESLSHIECYSDCARRGSHLIEPFDTVLFSVFNPVIVECCVLYPRCMGVFGMLVVM